ncbi:tyrosine-type recombinase/integrase [Rhizobium etli]|uniref:tyrosine-type recombinase/integrase n=1 Tax=Rhizobium etli TaxID=29449 RepID=UPI0003838F6A|nr:tyrosine-type recombinase/integrase [Rhizobium etli]AGS24564.1 phage integrase/recombinase family protein [Rhizobium etli bv. mimosae str. Mim1]AGS25148.1 phage integrase/recombinase family protein [Rhizobium etli bv. mimosae str. Mim1]AGS25197.1 phage integrase/recombinase family protein [Rhizobium etli bv. mimosae str. Mim1]
MTATVTLIELKSDAENFVTFKRAMGYRYQRGAYEIDRFLRFLEQRWNDEDTIPLADAISNWCGRLPDRKAISLSGEFGIIRQLCLHRRRRDPTCYVPEHAFAPVKESPFFPYIFSREEVLRILATASAHEGHFIWASMLRRLVLVLYCTGIRLGEATRLKMEDVDLDRGTLLIRNSKRRTRIVPIREDLIGELRLYLSDRHRLLVDLRRVDHGALFIRQKGGPLDVSGASVAIREILRRLDIKPARGRVGARPYEFRHTFAVHRLTAWAEEGADIHAKLPFLSAYLGHQNILGTEVYLKATPQLLELASARFEQHVRSARQPR